MKEIGKFISLIILFFFLNSALIVFGVQNGEFELYYAQFKSTQFCLLSEVKYFTWYWVQLLESSLTRNFLSKCLQNLHHNFTK